MSQKIIFVGANRRAQGCIFKKMLPNAKSEQEQQINLLVFRFIKKIHNLH